MDRTKVIGILRKPVTLFEKMYVWIGLLFSTIGRWVAGCTLKMGNNFSDVTIHADIMQKTTNYNDSKYKSDNDS